MKAALMLMLIYALSGTINVYADVDPETPWPIEQRCLPDPIQLPEDWTFEGTIMAAGWAGIHGMSATWDTPRVLAFNDGWITYGGSGRLSPDGRWYVVPQATYNIYNNFVDVEIMNLLFYDLSEGRVLRKKWNEFYNLSLVAVFSRYLESRTPAWFDDETVIYQRGETYYSIHLPDLMVEEWPDPARWGGISPVWTVISHPAPDWSRIVVRTTSNMEVFNTETDEIISVIYDPTMTIGLPEVAWHPHSTEFIISGVSSTSLYDMNGQLLHTISLSRNEDTFQEMAIRSNAYSADGARFYVLTGSGRSFPEHHLALAERSDLMLTDTCIALRSPAQFSPDGRYMAILSYTRGSQELLIFDIENWRLYRTGIYHDGGIIGWRED